ncbi:MAG: o-succinylbenzoate synthase, partial [Flavobacterium sp.]|nr:o-succinylbenzoate synthase [Flavobacterium sp.]
ATLTNALPQGLGTGSLYSNNFNCPLQVKHGFLYYDPTVSWEVNLI